MGSHRDYFSLKYQSVIRMMQSQTQKEMDAGLIHGLSIGNAVAPYLLMRMGVWSVQCYGCMRVRTEDIANYAAPPNSGSWVLGFSSFESTSWVLGSL